jgi:hypothetical protein
MKKLSETAAKIEFTLKVCSKCKSEKEVSEFSNDKSRKGGKNPRCKACDAVYFANRSEETRQKEVERQSSGRYSEYYAEYRNKNKEATKAYNKAYKPLNRAKLASLDAKRRAIKLKATPAWLTEQHFSEIEAVYSHARDCRVVTGEAYHVDHIVPLQGRNVCGLHVPWNLQILPAEVNVRKNNRYEEAECNCC